MQCTGGKTEELNFILFHSRCFINGNVAMEMMKREIILCLPPIKASLFNSKQAFHQCCRFILKGFLSSQSLANSASKIAEL